MEFLREIAHLRFRTNYFGCVMRLRHAMAFAIHNYFNDHGFAQAGDNQAAIDQLRIHYAEKEAALVKLHSASAAEARLKELGVELTLPQEPATLIKKK